jgi:hypothetical protein
MILRFFWQRLFRICSFQNRCYFVMKSQVERSFMKSPRISPALSVLVLALLSAPSYAFSNSYHADMTIVVRQVIIHLAHHPQLAPVHHLRHPALRLHPVRYSYRFQVFLPTPKWVNGQEWLIPDIA